ncbi:hypothetical protein CYY_000272 [Polysphondylium violaceum]|uniref:Uncharacterized protein n=1 Tax=Polysphondylium violaceum TaxID=133409 RepID=A0A8J4V2J6_9MYCE|nr:hypothetical protein CYY_000272 [Polysphondylium violaceum]
MAPVTKTNNATPPKPVVETLDLFDCNQDTEKIFQFLLHSQLPEETLLSIGKGFLDTRKEPQYAIKLCEKIQESLLVKQKELEDVRNLINKENKTKAAINLEVSTKGAYATPTKDQQDILDKIQYNNSLFQFIPATLKPIFTQQQRSITDASLLMIKSAYFIYDDIIKTTITTVNKSTTKMDAEKDNKISKEYQAFTEVVYQALSPIILPNMALEVAQFLKDNNLVALCCDVIERIAKKINEQRQREKTTLTKSTLNLDQISSDIFTLAITAIQQAIGKFELKIKISPTQVTERERKELTSLTNGQLLSEMIEKLIPDYLQDPSGIISVGKKLLEQRHYDHVITVAERARAKLGSLQKEQFERKKLEKRINELKTDIQSIIKVGGVPTLQREELNRLTELTKVDAVLPAYVFITNQKYSEFILEIATLRIKSILEMKEAAKHKGGLDVMPQLEDTLDTIIDPKHIYDLAILLSNKGETDAAIKYGERCQKFISDLEKLRDTRLPLQLQLDALMNEEKVIRQAGNSLTKAKQDKVLELQETISALPEWPYFGELYKRFQYDGLNLDIVKVMITCVLQNKKKLEDSKDKELKNRVNLQVSTLVTMCLEKFQDPAYLLKFANHMKDSKEEKVLNQVITQVFKRCQELEDQRVERKTMTSKLHSIIDQLAKGNINPKVYQELEKQKKKIEKDIEKLPIWPHYAQLDVEFQYDQTKFEASTILVKGVLETMNLVEEKLRKKKLHNLENINEEELLKEKEVLQQSLKNSLYLCLDNVKDPKSISQLAHDLGDNHLPLFLEIANYLHKDLSVNYIKAMEFKNNQNLYQVLNEELQELSKMKKEMSDEDLELLEKVQSKVKDVSFPYLNTYIEGHTLHSKLISKTIHLSLVNRAALIARSNNSDMTQKEIDAEMKQCNENIEKGFQNLSLYLEAPDVFLTILKDLSAKKEYQRVASVGRLAFTKLSFFRDFQQKVTNRDELKKTLSEERTLCIKQRKRMPTDKHKQLRDIIVEEKTNILLASFYKANLDDLALSLGNVLIKSATEEKAMIEAQSDQDDLRSLAAQRKKLTENINATVKFVVHHIKNIEALIKFANDLFTNKEYSLVLQVGYIIEDILEEKKKVIEEKEDLLKESKTLQQKFLHTTDMAERAKIQPLIDQVLTAHKNIIPTHTYEEIKDLTLKITKIMIDSANFEDLGDVLRAQIIISFKIDTTPEKWDQIRNLSSEEEWEATKKELVVFVMQREENIDSKIELLMKDGLFEQCIEIFPHPSLEEDELDTQLNLLESLYDAIDQYQFELLTSVLPIVQKYAKRCYQEWKPEKLDTLFDSVQRRFPIEIKDMFEKATEMILVNILQSQYPIFLGMMKSFKNRMVKTLGLESLWTEFLEKFKKTHKGKKRLIQMVSFIGDAVWNIEAPNQGPTASGKKRSSTRNAHFGRGKTSVTPLKKIKVTSSTISSINPSSYSFGTPAATPSAFGTTTFGAKKTVAKKPRSDSDEDEDEDEVEEDFYKGDDDDDDEDMVDSEEEATPKKGVKKTSPSKKAKKADSDEDEDEDEEGDGDDSGYDSEGDGEDQSDLEHVEDDDEMSD